ncbi:nucleotide-binding protein [Lachnotalea sp. AF33-28]|jgi:nitrogenase iron protein NifH|uniref:nucleotide-binding protein n=1 Tax=Lachnotalea sp. AF33-28 TaxID=2292046 RepID=UPI000E552254|nr:hypothetical protein [Lachnotalea sp. AF33-28]RHP32322.1 hypothetical protein DWZ56_13460 [Lachnotalea sp. AF33-28]
MIQKIGFLGKGGIGKSTIICHLSAALSNMGYHVLQIGNDISLNSTAILRGDQDIIPVLEEYREKYVLNLEDYIVKSGCGVYCMELGSLDPGVGCMARSIDMIDDMLVSQGIYDKLALDFLFYDVSVDSPCSGYMLPIRNHAWSRSVIFINSGFPSIATANCILNTIKSHSAHQTLPVQLIISEDERAHNCGLPAAFAEAVNVPVLSCVHQCHRLEECSELGRTIYQSSPDCAECVTLNGLAQKLLEDVRCSDIQPFQRKDLLEWNRKMCKKC